MYIVIELQTNKGTSTATPYALEDQNVAFQKFHQILAAAAVSKVETHAALILTESGETISRGLFVHPAEEASN